MHAYGGWRDMLSVASRKNNLFSATSYEIRDVHVTCVPA